MNKRILLIIVISMLGGWLSLTAQIVPLPTTSVSEDEAYETLQLNSGGCNYLRIELKQPALYNSKILIQPVLSQDYREYELSEGENNITIDVADIQSGTCVVSYVVNGEVFDSKKFNK